MAHVCFGWGRRFHAKSKMPLNLVAVQRIHPPEDCVFTRIESFQAEFQCVAFPNNVGVSVIDAFSFLVENLD